MLAKIFPKTSVCVYLKHRKEFIKTTGGRIHTNHSFNLDLKCFHAQINITFRFLLQFTRVFFYHTFTYNLFKVGADFSTACDR